MPSALSAIVACPHNKQSHAGRIRRKTRPVRQTEGGEAIRGMNLTFTRDTCAAAATKCPSSPDCISSLPAVETVKTVPPNCTSPATAGFPNAPLVYLAGRPVAIETDTDVKTVDARADSR
jgi:hypothetical protein